VNASHTSAVRSRTGRRVAVAGGLCAVALAMVPTTAAAAPPERTVITVDDTDFAVKSSGICGFDILLHTKGTIRITDYVDRDGTPTRSLVTYPGLTYTFINASTGESVTSVSPDPEHYSWNADGSFTMVVTGLIMHWVVPGEGVLGADAGRLVVTVAADGTVTEEETGHHEPRFPALCHILAP
jgi:hypothetical protein